MQSKARSRRSLSVTVISGAEMSALFDGYQRTAWRFETQPVYTMPDEQASIARFLTGEPKPSDHNEDWHETVRSYVALERKSVVFVLFGNH